MSTHLNRAQKEREEFSLRLIEALKAAGLYNYGVGKMLAEKCNVTPKASNKWLNAESIPRHEKAITLAGIVKMPVEELLYGKPTISEAIEKANVSSIAISELRKAPLISSVQAGDWEEAIDNYHPGDGEDEFLITVPASKNSFWLKVVGDSMTSPQGLSVPEGYMILVDPDEHAENGKLVVAKLLNSNEVTFKQLIRDAGTTYLKPLNSSYRTIEINEKCKIIGVVKEIRLGV